MFPQAQEGEMAIINENGDIISVNYREINNTVGLGNTLKFRYHAGMNDSFAEILNESFKEIIPKNKQYYKTDVVQTNNVIYCIGYATTSNTTDDYYYLHGNKIDDINFNVSQNQISYWAKKDVKLHPIKILLLIMMIFHIGLKIAFTNNWSNK